MNNPPALSFRLFFRGSLLSLSVLFSSLVSAEPLPSDLDSYIESGMAKWQLPGMSIAVVKDGEPILLKGYGVREVGKPDPVDADTLFAIGSASKAFTATALGMLVDHGKVNWNTRVHDIDPDLKLSDPWITKEIRLSDLLSNHSGLSGVSEFLWYGTGFSREEIIVRLKYVPFSEGFRYQYQYRNTMFLLAGQMIPHLVDQTWDGFIVEEVFTPLEMSRSLPTDEGIEKYTNVAAPHLIDYEGRPIAVSYRKMTNIAPAGSILSTAHDLVPWIKVHLGQSEVPLLEEETLRFLHTSQTPMWMISPEGEVQNSPIPLQSYCLGWVTESYNGHRIVWHNGNIDGMSAWVGLVPELGLGVAMLSNLDNCDLRKAIFYKIVDHAIGIEGEDLVPQLLEKYEKTLAHQDEAEEEWQELAEPGAQPGLSLESYAGIYHSDLLGSGTVFELNNRLFYRRTSEQTLELVPAVEGGNEFIGRQTNSNEDLRTGKVDVEFEVSEGKVTALIDRFQGLAIRFARVDE